MTNIYFAGTEDVSFTFTQSATGTIYPTTTSTYFRTAFSRSSLVFNGTAVQANTTSWPMPDSLSTSVVSLPSSFWVHGQFSNQGFNNTTASAILLGVADSSGVGRILVRGTGTTGQLKISTRNAAGTITDLVTSAAGAYILTNGVSGGAVSSALDLFVNYSTSGQITLYQNGAIICDTGPGVNVTTDGATSLSQVFYGTAFNSTNRFQAWSECLVQDTTTLGCAVQTNPPVAAGNTQSWTGVVGSISETTISDTTFIDTTADNALSEWTVNAALPAGNWTIEAVVQAARVSVGATGPQHFAWDVRTSAGASFQTGAIAATVGSFHNFSNVWYTNPSTSAAWTAGQLVNAGIESLA